jgi:phage shock protein A
MNLLQRIINLFRGIGNAKVTAMESENMEQLLELQVQEANKGLIKAQAGVAQSYAAVASAEDELKKLTEMERTLTARFKALDQAGNARANDTALAVQKTKGDIVTWTERLKLAKVTADQNQKALNIAREKLKENVAEARKNISEARINTQLAGALEVASGLITQTTGSTYEMNRIATMAREANNAQKGRIMASQNSLEASGLMDTAAEEEILKEDAAAELRASLGLAPKTKKVDAAPAPTEAPITEKPGM